MLHTRCPRKKNWRRSQKISLRSELRQRTVVDYGDPITGHSEEGFQRSCTTYSQNSMDDPLVIPVESGVRPTATAENPLSGAAASSSSSLDIVSMRPFLGVQDFEEDKGVNGMADRLQIRIYARVCSRIKTICRASIRSKP